VYNSDVPYAILAFPPFQGNTEKGITFGSLLTGRESIWNTRANIIRAILLRVILL
jgi:hypothetical protein